MRRRRRRRMRAVSPWILSQWPAAGRLDTLLFYTQMSGITMIMDVVYFVWILPSVLALEGKLMYNSCQNVNGGFVWKRAEKIQPSSLWMLKMSNCVYLKQLLVHRGAMWTVQRCLIVSVLREAANMFYTSLVSFNRTHSLPSCMILYRRC